MRVLISLLFLLILTGCATMFDSDQSLSSTPWSNQVGHESEPTSNQSWEEGLITILGKGLESLANK
jgi:hypothetical protein